MSHAAAEPVRDAVLGYGINSPSDIIRLGELVRRNGLDIAQPDRTFRSRQVNAARSGIGDDAILMVGAGTTWHDHIEAARARLSELEQHRALWLEEPFVGEAVHEY